MKLSFSLSLLLVFELLGTCLLAQNKIIEVDSVSGLPSQALPFDEPFVLKIPTRSSRITAVSFMPHIGRKTFGQTLLFRDSIKEEQGWPRDNKIREISATDFTVRKMGDKNYLLITFRDPLLLSPGKRYTIFWAEDVSDKVMKLVDLYHKAKRTPAQATIDDVRKVYKTLAGEVQSTFDYPLNFPNRQEDIDSLTRVKRLYVSKDLKSSYDSLERREIKFDSLINRSSTLVKLKGNGSLSALARALITRSPDFDRELRQKYFSDEVKATARLLSLTRLDKLTHERILKGLQSLDCNQCDQTPVLQYETRQATIKATIKAIDELVTVADLLAYSARPELQPALSALQSLQAELTMVKKSFDDVVEVRVHIKNKIFPSALSNLTTLGGSTFVYTFEARNKLSISPDFGIVTTRIGNDGSNPYSFVPYLGFHINMRPINRDVPFKSYKHTLSHRLSLMFGWSMVSVDNGPKLSPGADSVTSFFSKGKGTLLTGLGIRLGNAVRITTGYMWYFGYTTNGAKPVVYDQRHLRTWPFVGLSLDLSLKDLLNGITDVFSAAPRRFAPPAPAVVPAAN